MVISATPGIQLSVTVQTALTKIHQKYPACVRFCYSIIKQIQVSNRSLIDFLYFLNLMLNLVRMPNRGTTNRPGC